MNVSKAEIGELEEWLKSRLGALISHSEKVREVLQASGGAETIIKSAMEIVSDEGQTDPNLTPQQAAVWKALLPILAEHGLMAVRGSGLPRDDERPLSKEEAAEFLGFSTRKLERAMKKRQIDYEKFGTGKTATVRFRRAALEKFAESRRVPARGSQGSAPSA